MQFQKLSFLAAATWLAAACGSSSPATPDALAAAVPDFAGVSLEATGAASESATLSAGAAATAGTPAPSGLEFLPTIRQGICDLNQAVQQDFAPSPS